MGSPSQVQEIKDKLDIVDVIGQRIPLQRGGKNLKAPCPFHSEKSPSFFVSPELQSFKCFGCGKSGDVITFVQEFDRLTFPEALELLAKEAGVELTQDFQDPQEKERRRILEALDYAQQFYTYLLQEHAAGKPGRDYIAERKVSAKLQKQFALGFAPDTWDQLSTYLLKKKKFSPAELEAAGLSLKGKRGMYDRFRGRLIFPLHDHRGRVVGFSGRLLAKDVKEAKYINTPETMVYHKRSLLFGYHQNLEAIREKKAVIIMEGEFDVLSSVAAHVKHVVAVKGSALTVEQVRILARTVQTIYLALDADSAGIEATKRAIEVVQGFPVALRIIPLTGGKDPDEMARQDPGGWREQIDQHESAFEYVLTHTLKKYDVKTADGQRRATDELLQLLLKIDHPVERSFYLRTLSESLNLGENVLEEQLDRLRRQSHLPRPTVSEPEEKPVLSHDEVHSQEAYMWQLALQKETKPFLIQLTPNLFVGTLYQRLAQELETYFQKHEAFSLKEFSQQLPAELQSAITQLYLEDLPIESEKLDEEFSNALQSLKTLRKKQRREKLSKLMAQLEREGKEDSEEYLAALKEFGA
jgi:DNA primase